MKIQVAFRIGREVVEDNSWKNPTILPRVGESICLGCDGKYSWYTIKSINWASANDVIFVLTNKRDVVEL